MRISDTNFADIMGVSKRTLVLWKPNGRYVPEEDEKGNKFFRMENLSGIPEINEMMNSRWNEELECKPLRA